MAKYRRPEIVRRAAELFSQQGVSRTTIEDIAAAADLKRQGAYYYFKNRDDILLEKILPRSRSMMLFLQQLMRSNISSFEKPNLIIEGHLDAYDPSYIEMSVALKEMHFDVDNDRMNELRAAWDEYSKLWARLIREGQERGGFNAEMSPMVAAFGLLGMCTWLFRWHDPDKLIFIKDISLMFSNIAATSIKA